jgi:hypothetical protein
MADGFPINVSLSGKPFETQGAAQKLYTAKKGQAALALTKTQPSHLLGWN